MRPPSSDPHLAFSSPPSNQKAPPPAETLINSFSVYPDAAESRRASGRDYTKRIHPPFSIPPLLMMFASKV